MQNSRLQDQQSSIRAVPPEPAWLRQPWAQDHPLRSFPNPYPRWEAFKLIFREIFGPSHKNKNLVPWIPRHVTLNKISPRYKIAFIGDIMEMREFRLELDEKVIEFLADADLVIGNAEATLTLMRGEVMAQRYGAQIIESLSSLVQGKHSKLLLTFANNHAGDFGIADYSLSLNRFAWAGFQVIGRKDIPSYLHDGVINLVAGTNWSDQQDCTYVTRISDCEMAFNDQPDIFNILLPHWGYEMELWPRPKTLNVASHLLEKWDLIFGSHPHTPQAVTTLPRTPQMDESIKKLVCFSGGNFTSGLNERKHNWGIILKCEIGSTNNSSGKLAIGNVDWSFVNSEKQEITRLERKEKGPLMRVKLVSSCPYFPGI